MWPLFCKKRWYPVMIGSAPVAIVTVSSQTTAIRIVCLSNNFPIGEPSPYHDNPMIRWQWWGLHWLKNPFVCNLNPCWKLKWLDHWTRSSKQRIAFILEHKCIWWTIDLERWIWSGAVLRVHLHSSDQDNKVQRIGPGNHSFQWRPFQRPPFLFFGWTSRVDLIRTLTCRGAFALSRKTLFSHLLLNPLCWWADEHWAGASWQKTFQNGFDTFRRPFYDQNSQDWWQLIVVL